MSTNTTHINAAFVKAQMAFKAVLKTADNPYFKSKYCDLASCIEAVQDALHEQGLAITQRTLPGNADGVTVETVLLHESGDSLSGGQLYVPASKEDPQGFGSALTYARRYSLMACLGIAPEDDDSERGSGRQNGRPIERKPATPAKATAPTNWKAVIWHLDFGERKGGGFEFKGHSLAEILLNAKADFAFWVRTYKPIGKSKEDLALRVALDQAKEELARAEASAPEEEPQQAPSEDLPQVDTTDSQADPREKALAEMRELCRENHVEESFITEMAVKKKKLPKGATDMSEASLEMINGVLANFQWFVNNQP